VANTNKLSELGNLLINLEKESNPTKKILTYLICLILIAISYYFKSKAGFFAIALFVVLEVMDSVKFKKSGRGIYEKGLCFNGVMTQWSDIKSYEWVESSVHSHYGLLKITQDKKMLFGATLSLPISDTQKNEVGKILNKKLKNKLKKN